MLKRYILALSAFLCALLIPTAGTFAADTDVIENTEAGIPDKTLYQEILKQLGKTTETTFTEGEAKGIKELDLSFTDVQSLTGIGYLSELTELNLQDSSLKSLKGLEQLTKLDSLYLYRNTQLKLKNLKPLKDLKSLEMLDVSMNKITSLAGIESLANLKRLFIGSNRLKNLNGIEKLTNLTALCASYNNLTHLKGIEQLKHLDSIQVRGNDLTSINEVKNLTNLTSLDVSENRLENGNAIRALKKLESLELNGNRIKKLPNMKNFTKLKSILCKFTDNCLTEKELSQKLPAKFLKKKSWMNKQIKMQNITHGAQISYPKNKKLSASTKKLEGRVSVKGATVVLMNMGWNDADEDCTGGFTRYVTPDKNGRFQIKNLNLKKFKGNKARIYLSINNELCMTNIQFTIQ